MKRLLSGITTVLFGTALLAGAVPAEAARFLLINGAGATFPYPIYSKWFAEYAKVDQTVNFNYQSIGSGGGVRQIMEQTVDFGASDGPMTDELLAQSPGAILHIPTVLGGVVATYNIPGVDQKLNFTQEAIVGIFMGNIKKWNHEAIAGVNPGVNLPDKSIVVVHRSDGSGTTYIWTDFLSNISPAWKNKVGTDKSVKWPVGLGGKGNEGVSGLVKQTPYSIGYVELGYALHNKLNYGRIENAEGEFVDCTTESVSLAAAGAADAIPSDYRVSLVNAPGRGTYPVASFTWLLVYQEQANPEKGRKLVEFLRWMLRDGQQYAATLGYAPLPDVMRERITRTIDTIRVQ